MEKILKTRIVRGFVALLASIMLVIIAPLAAIAVTTADVVITATPSYIAMTNTPSSWAAGILAAGSSTATANDSYFTANNTGSVAGNITLLVTTTNWTGGVGWIHSDTATAGTDTVGLKCGTKGSGSAVTIIKTTAMTLINNLAAANSTGWGMTILAPTVYNDGVQKTVTVRLTIVIS